MSAGRAAALLREAPFCQLVVHPDADSVSAAALLGLALQRAGVPWQARFGPDHPASWAGLAEDPEAQPVLIGLGARDPAALDALPKEAIVLDPRSPAFPGKRALLVAEACASAAAWQVAREVHPRTGPLLALAGLEACWPGERAEGLRATWRDGTTEGPVPAFPPLPLVEALAGSVDPFLPALSGRARAAKRFVEQLGLRADSITSDLADGPAGALASALTLHLLARGAPPAALRPLLLPDLHGPVAGTGARGLARLLDACCGAGKPAWALALALGDRRAEPEALALAEARRQRLLSALLKLESEGVQGQPLRVDADLGGDVAWGAACALTGGQPVMSLAQHDGQAVIHVGAPLGSAAHLGQLAWDAGHEHDGGWGHALGGRAVVGVPSEHARAAVERLRKGLGP